MTSYHVGYMVKGSGISDLNVSHSPRKSLVQSKFSTANHYTSMFFALHAASKHESA